MPVNENNTANKEGGSHWSLLVYSKHDDKWYHFDSKQGSNIKHARRLVSRVNSYLSDKTQPTLVETSCTQQSNNYDCGAYTMVYAQMAIRRAIEGKPLNKCYVDRNEATKIRERMHNLISLERQTTKTIEKGEKEGKKVIDKIRDDIGKEREEIKEFIATICGEENISENTKRDILKYYDGKNHKEERTKMGENEKIQQKIESVCRNWAKDTCKKGESCIYKHPVRCEEMMKKGYCNDRQYRRCKYYHPKICWDNLKQERCRRGDRCTYRHTHREIIGYDDLNSRKWNQQRESFRKYDDKIREVSEKDKYCELQDSRGENDFLWKKLHPWEKEQIIKIWNQERAERRHRNRWY